MPSGFYSVTVSSVTRETNQAVSITFDIPALMAPLFAYKSGQYLTISASIDGEEVRRSYSMCSSPHTDSSLSIAVKRVDGGRMSNFLNDHVKVGDQLIVMPPMGSFLLNPQPSAANHYVFFGGGSGITPLISIIKTVLNQEPNSNCLLVYANRDEENIIFGKELDTMESNSDGKLKIIHSLDNPLKNWEGLKGHLTSEKIADIVKDELGFNYPTAHYYTCGPRPMMDLVLTSLTSMGVRDENVNIEYFSAAIKEEKAEPSISEENYSDEIIERTVQIEVYGQQKDVIVKPEQTILIAAQEAGLDPPYSCTVGVCTTCRARLRSGKASMEEREGLSDSEIEEGFILTCQAHPLTDGVDLVFE